MKTENDHQHSLVRIIGFDLAITPMAAFCASATIGIESYLSLELADGAFAEIIARDGGFRSRIDPSTTSSVYDVAKIESSASKSKWEVQTSIYTVEWPMGLKLRSCDYPSSSSPFEFYYENRVLLFIQNPQAFPSLPDMCAPGQSIVELDDSGDKPSVLLSYRRSWQRWQQRHSVLNVGRHRLVLTAQYPLTEKNLAQDAIRELESTIRP